MSPISNLALCSLAAALFATTGAHAASSVLGDTFQVDAVIDGVSGGPFSGIAGALGDDVSGTFDSGLSEYTIYVNWFDHDSFDLRFEATNASDLYGMSFSLSGLDFKDGAQARGIVGAAFNPNENGYLGYMYDPVSNPSGVTRPPDPILAFTSNSVTATFDFFPRQLVGDQPTMRFDVTPAVPEPGSTAMLLAGLAGLVGVARRRSSAY